MISSPAVVSVGAVCFGIVIGFIVYRTLIRKDGAAITDISGVIGAVGGGAVSVWYDRSQGDSFAWYSIGLLVGLALYYVSFLALNGRSKGAQYLGGEGERDIGLPKRRGVQPTKEGG